MVRRRRILKVAVHRLLVLEGDALLVAALLNFARPCRRRRSLDERLYAMVRTTGLLFFDVSLAISLGR